MNDLIESAQRGDHDAFEELMLPRASRMLALAMLTLHDRTLAEDAVQESLVRAWRSLPSLRRHDRFEAWLRRLIVNACIDVARAAQRHRVVEQLPADLRGGADIESAAADRDAVERAFADLSIHHRVVFVLRHYESRTLPEIASACGIPLGTAKSRLHHAEKEMARSMREADADVIQGEPA